MPATATHKTVRTRNGISYNMPEPTDFPGVEVIVDLDDPDTARYMDAHSSGEEVMRLHIVKGGKRVIVWVSVANFYGGKIPEVLVGVQRPATSRSCGDKRHVIKAKPCWDVERQPDGTYRPTK
jgi:hypothetical protein